MIKLIARVPLIVSLLLVCSSTLFITRGLYASEEDSALVELQSRLAKQTPEQDKQAKKLSDAIHGNNIQEVQALLTAKADANALTSYGKPMLHYAKTPEMLKLLLDHKAGVNSINKNKVTALHWLCSDMPKATGKRNMQNRIQNCILTLLHHGANTNACDKDGETPLVWYVRPCMPESRYVDVFLEHGVHINSTVCDMLRSHLESDDCSRIDKIRVCKIILTLADYPKRMESRPSIIDKTLAPVLFSPLISIITAYDRVDSSVDGEELNALLDDFKELFDEFRARGELS